MTRDQLFALPVGTRLTCNDLLDFQATIMESPKTQGFITLLVRFPPADIDQLAADLVVIPGELDASEGVE